MLIDGFHFDLEGLRILPGLINAHDHLEFALFPRLGSRIYRNAAAWARDIYRPKEQPLRDHARMPKAIRLLWGGLRNLLAGVTTVCHHNPYEPVFEQNFPVRVVKEYSWAHSLEFTPDLRERFAASPEDQPFILHLGEGTDRPSAEEIFILQKMGALTPRTVLVHAVALDSAGWELVRKSGASVIWCPRSNLFMLGRTLDIPSLRALGISLALGSDSPLTADGDLLDEIACARALGVDDASLQRWTGDGAAKMLRLSGTSDFIAVREFGAPPELVVVRGRVQLISERLASALYGADLTGWSRLHVASRPPVLVRFDIPRLIERTHEFLGCGPVRLGGREVSS